MDYDLKVSADAVQEILGGLLRLNKTAVQIIEQVNAQQMNRQKIMPDPKAPARGDGHVPDRPEAG